MKDPAAFDFDGKYGEDYAVLAERVIPGYEQIFPITLSLLEMLLDDDAHILVVGCGPGPEIMTFGTAHPRWQFTAVDPSRYMVDVTLRLVQRLGMTDRVRTFHGFVHDLPPDERYDAATIINVLHFLDDEGGKELLIQSVADRLCVGAPLALFDLHGNRKSQGGNLMWKAWLRFIDMRGWTGAKHEQLVRRLESGIVFVPEARILEICAGVGLTLTTRYLTGLLYGGWLFERRS